MISLGPQKLPYYDSPSLGVRLGGAICFDFDYPFYIQQAGFKHVDIMLQPSWTWNAINFRHFDGNAVRNVENGFTSFRCSSDGESGIVSRRGKILQRRYSGQSMETQRYPYVFGLPIEKRVVTLYSVFGIIFEYLIIAASFYYITMAYIIEYVSSCGQDSWDNLPSFLQCFITYIIPEQKVAELLSKSSVSIDSEQLGALEFHT